jgi:hypothetical protein
MPPHNPLLAFPKEEIAATHVTMIIANITAYSTAVAASSFRKKAWIAFITSLSRWICCQGRIERRFEGMLGTGDRGKPQVYQG